MNEWMKKNHYPKVKERIRRRRREKGVWTIYLKLFEKKRTARISVRPMYQYLGTLLETWTAAAAAAAAVYAATCSHISACTGETLSLSLSLPAPFQGEGSQRRMGVGGARVKKRDSIRSLSLSSLCWAALKAVFALQARKHCSKKVTVEGHIVEIGMRASERASE